MAWAIEKQEDSTSQEKSLVRKRLIWVMLLRVGLISILLSATMIVNYRSSDSFLGPSTRFLLGLIAATYFCTIIYALWYRANRAIGVLSRVQLSLDLVFWGCLTYTTGGIVSGFTFLFDLWVIVSAVVLGGRAAYYSAIASMLILVGLATAMYTNTLVPISDQIVISISAKEVVYFLSLNIVALFLVAGLVNSLVARLESTGLGLEVERARRADLTQLHADIIRSLTVGLATTGNSGEVYSMNPAGLDILELEIEKAEGQELNQWLPEIEKQLTGVKSLLSRGRGIGIKADGTQIPVEYIVAPLVRADGRRRGSIVVFSDLTEVHRLEAEIEKSSRMAALGELAASLAHEIRNPLGAISGSFQMLSSRPDLNGEDSALVDIISRELRRIERLVNDMMDYVRPGSKIKRESTELGKLVNEVTQMFLMGDETSGRNLRIDSAEKIVVEIDQSQIRQVLWNLLRNATQATDPGDDITVKVYQSNSSIIVEVWDTGHGIKDRDSRQIFDPFVGTRERGLGLGLALCKRIVENHGGCIEAAPGDRRGSVFRITLPKDTSRADV